MVLYYNDESVALHRRRDVDAQDVENSTIINEAHHQIRNNLQFILSMMSLQSCDTTCADEHKVCTQCKDRIFSMAMVYEYIYEFQNQSSIDLNTAVRSIIHGIVSSNDTLANGVYFKLPSDKLLINVRDAVPCALIINEIVSYSILHTSGSDEISIDIQGQIVEQDTCVITVRLKDVNFFTEDELKKNQVFEARFIRMLAEQLRGNISIYKGKDTTVSLMFPIK